MPDEWKSLEIWRLIKRSGGDFKKTKRVWECHYFEGIHFKPKEFEDTDLDDEKSWKFKDDPNLKDKNKDVEDGERGKFRNRARTGDSVVIFGYAGGTKKLVYIPRFVIGETGCVFRHGDKGWERVIDRWQPQRTGKSRIEDAISHFVPEEPLLCTNMASSRPGADSKLEFHYYFIHPDQGLKDTEEGYEYLTTMYEPPEEGPMPEWKKKLFDHYQELKTEWDRNLDNREKREEAATKFVEELSVLSDVCAPDAVGGATTPLVISIFVNSILENEKVISEVGAHAGSGITGAPLGILELGAVGFQVIIHSVKISRLRKKKREHSDQWGPLEEKRLSEESKDLGTALGRAPQALVDSATAVIDVIASVNLNASIVGGASALDEGQVASMVSHASAVGGFVGLAVNVGIAARNIHEARNKALLLAQFKKKMDTIVFQRDKDEETLYGQEDVTQAHRNKLYALGVCASRKLKRGVVRKGLTGGVACVSALGSGFAALGGLAALGVIGLANIWNPLGWTLGAIAIAGGIGIAGYVLYRRITRKRRARERAKAWGVANYKDFARQLVQLHIDAKVFKDKPLLSATTGMITSFVREDNFRGLDEKQKWDDLRTLIEGKLKT
jgi:hypothetical protein